MFDSLVNVCLMAQFLPTSRVQEAQFALDKVDAFRKPLVGGCLDCPWCEALAASV